MFSIGLLLSALALIYILLKSHYEYWSKRGIPGPKPNFFVGNIGQTLLFKTSLGDVVSRIYKQYNNAPLVGIFRGTSPALIVRDPNIIRDIIAKDFTHFNDNDIGIHIETNPLFGRNPFFLNGGNWKTVRAQLSSCFSSGKIKTLYPVLDEMGRRMVKFVHHQLDDDTCNDGFEVKELCTKFTLNNVAGCIFGLEGRCFDDPNSEFHQIGRKFSKSTGWGGLLLMLSSLIPEIKQIVNLKFMRKDIEEQLVGIADAALKYRKENNIERNDFLQTISQLKTTSKDQFTDIDVYAHIVGFFGDGFETSSIAMSFLLYNLANNPDVQTKLQHEIDEYFENNDDKLNYESVWNMPYLDASLRESLRLHPVVSVLTKRCTETYTYNSGDITKRPLIIEKDTSIIIPAIDLHTDPKYYTNPETFMPERFLGENKQKLNKYTYLPFGEGPRACLGQRFAQLQIKVGVAYIIRNFELSLNDKTQIPLKFDPLYFMMRPIGGLWVNFKRRKL